MYLKATFSDVREKIPVLTLQCENLDHHHINNGCVHYSLLLVVLFKHVHPRTVQSSRMWHLEKPATSCSQLQILDNKPVQSEVGRSRFLQAICAYLPNYMTSLQKRVNFMVSTMITSNLTNVSLCRSNSQQNQHLSWNQTDQLAKSAVQTSMILTYSRTLIIQFVTAAGKVLDLRCCGWWLELLVTYSLWHHVAG